jgi:uncharacterized membrane protein YeaQ/YmgE (transglycosylase-associated protein family)
MTVVASVVVSITALQVFATRHDRVYLLGFSMDRGLLAWIVIGLLAGWIAGTITRGRGFGCIVDIILGLVGAVIGGWIFTRLGIATWGFLGSLAAATVGAIVLVAIARLFSGSSD